MTISTFAASGTHTTLAPVDYEPGDKCPKQIEMTHDELNKDKSGEGRDAQYEAAMALAVEQTRHEWCRLVTLTRARWGEAGEWRLLAWIADPASAPVCGDAPVLR